MAEGDDALWQRLAVPPGPPRAPDAVAADDAALWQRLTTPPPAPVAATPAATAQPIGRLGRFMTGLGDVGYGAAQLMQHIAPSGSVMDQLTSGIDQRVQQRESEYQAGRAAAGSTGTDWLRMGGQAVSGLPVAALAAPLGLPAAAAAGVATGAGLSALQPVTEPGNFWEEKATQALIGGATGGVGGAAGNLLGRAISPRIAPNVRTLADAGVEMTPGQVLGGLAQRMENKAASSVPLVGDAIAGAQRRSLESFNRATANRVLEPLGQAVPDNMPVGREMVSAVEDTINGAYQTALGRVQPFGPDAQFVQDLAAVSRQFMTPDSRNTFNRAVTDRIVSRFQSGPLDGATYKTIDAELGQIARTYSASTSAAEREIAQGIRGIQGAMRSLIARANPAVAPDIRAADDAFARFVRLEGAAASQGATEGVFSPQQLSAAVRAGDRTPRRGNYATGDALMQDFSDAARAVLPNSIPNSGTADRLMQAALLGGVASGTVPAATLAAGPAAGLLYSRPMTSAFSAAALAPRPAAVGLLGDAIAGSGGAVSVPLGALLLAPPEGRPEQRR